MATYNYGDFMKIDFPNDTVEVSEWLWARVIGCDDEQQLVYCILDNEPLDDHDDRIGLGSRLVVSFLQIREHRKLNRLHDVLDVWLRADAFWLLSRKGGHM
jgi:hypothetical protein